MDWLFVIYYSGGFGGANFLIAFEVYFGGFYCQACAHNILPLTTMFSKGQT